MHSAGKPQLHVLQASLTFVLFELQEHTVRSMHCPLPQPVSHSPSLALSEVFICQIWLTERVLFHLTYNAPHTLYTTLTLIFLEPTLITTQLLHGCCLTHNSSISTKVCILLLSGDAGMSSCFSFSFSFFFFASPEQPWSWSRQYFDQTDRKILFAYVGNHICIQIRRNGGDY